MATCDGAAFRVFFYCILLVFRFSLPFKDVGCRCYGGRVEFAVCIECLFAVQGEGRWMMYVFLLVLFLLRHVARYQ